MTAAEHHEDWWQVPRRRADRRVVTGVAGGIADELGVDPIVVRTAFVVLTIAGGWGVPLYAAAWLWSSFAAPDDAATSRPKGRSEQHRHLAIGLGVLGLLLLVRGLGLGFIDTLVWPAAALALGFVVVWHRARADDIDLATSLAGGASTRWTGIRIMAGVAIAAGGVTALFALNFDLNAASHVMLGSVVVLGGLALVLGPWIMRMINDLTRERRLRIRSEERTEVAAHLHDSVLQTLALIQRNADDSQAMVQLARRQERELRNWLYGGGGAPDATLRRALLDLAAEVDELHGVPVEAVVVGDFDGALDASIVGLLGAAREAVVNAAKHSGSTKIDLFCEIMDDRIDVFVRDTGRGFDPDAIPDDRRGLTDSIRGRMDRVGGDVRVTTTVGEGTEVELSIPHPAPETST